MKKYSYREMIHRLLGKASSIKFYLVVSASASVIGNLSRMGLLGFGAMWILTAYGITAGNPAVYAVSTAISGLLIAVCRYLEGVYSHRGAYGLLADMRVDLYEKIDERSPALLIDHKMGDIMNMAVGDIEQLEFFFAHMIGPMITVILLPLISVALAFHYNAVFGWILIPVYVIVSIVIPLTALKAGRRTGADFRRNQAALKSTILESVYGMKDIQIFDAGEKKLQEMNEKNDALNHAAHGLKIHRAVLTSIPDFFVYAVRVFLIAAGAYLAGHGAPNPAGTIVVSFVATASFSSTFSLTAVVTNLLETFASAERIFNIEDMRPAVQESDHARSIGKINEIVFENVSFAYPGTNSKVLDHASFTIKKGDRIGFIGDSGAGKSTILRLMLRFYDPQEGNIYMNGINLKDISFHSLHDHISLLEQDTYLFDDTILENIAISKPGSTQEDVARAAQKAGIDAFIQTLPDGYLTSMGTMNARVSGGERQRIGLARLLLKDTDTLIFDEPTSSLDVLHEKEFLHTLHAQENGRTIIMISHRMSTLSDCTRIFRLKDGIITEEKHV